MPLRKIAGIIVGRFLFAPHVEGFILNNETHLVAQLKQLGCRWIVRGANGVAAHCLQNLQLTLQCPRVDGSTHSTQIVVVTYAQNFGRFAIQEKTFFGIKFKRSNAEICFILIDDLPVFAQFADGFVSDRIVDGPQVRMIHRQHLCYLMLAASRDG